MGVRRLPVGALAVLGLMLDLMITGCGPTSGPATRQTTAAATSVPATPAPSQSVPAAALASSSTAPSPATAVSSSTATSSSTSAGSTSTARSSGSAADRLAGVRSKVVPWKASGRLRTVPGHTAAPGKGRIYTVRVEVESGLDIDRTAFAGFVLATLNDKRSWTEHGRRRFARTDGAADIRVVLASPATSAAMCAPLRTFGKLSCRSGANSAVLTYYRWIKAIPEYSGNPNGYRHYVVNHEVGHVLGHHHEYCAGKGKVAPVMMQQTKGLKGCRPNPWPHP
jgi:hypothetical protein